MKHIVSSVDEGSPLRRKVNKGDELISVNGHRIIDVLDYKFYCYEPRLVLQFLTPDGKMKLVGVKKNEGGDVGLNFETYLMDRPRSCCNRCVFCFVDQMPEGMRKSLYFKDDDARLSFLMGCYITLTNLSEREVQRICDLHISPVNISVHATDPEVRRKMLKNPCAGECMDIMRRFAAAGITMNCQIVCCPGLNDGEVLDRSMRELFSLHPAVHSVSIVPVGLTRYREGLDMLAPFDERSAARTVSRVAAFGDECIKKCGERIFFCSDELYLKAGLPLPPDEFYEDHAQLENGVGMLRLLESEFRLALKMADTADKTPFSIACGMAAAGTLEGLLREAKERFPELHGRVYAIKNDFFGESVTVSGLVTGRDLIAQLSGRELGERLLVSQSMLRRDELDFLDGVTLEEAAQALGVPVYPIEQDGAELCDAVLGSPPPLRAPKRDGEDPEYNKYNQN